MRKKLVVFTLQYPDTFLSNELRFLQEAFDHVYVLTPVIQTTNNERGITLIKLTSSYQPANIKRLFLKHIFTVLRIYSYSLLRRTDTFYYFKYYRSFLGHLLRELELIKPLEEIILKYGLKDALFYDYWFTNATIALAELKRQRKINVFVARAHRYDLYDEVQYERRLSFRGYRVKYIDRIFSISLNGHNYLRERVAERYKTKIKLSYLGISGRDSVFIMRPIADKKVFTIVSCSRLIPFKRVELIIDVLSEITLSIHWIHFGDGPERENIKKKAKELPPNVSFEMKGAVDNREIISFYTENCIDLFISLSKSEGLPVSMMEAISAGIPLFAYPANGVPEIVNSDTGVLLSADVTIEEIRDELVQTLLARIFNRDKIRTIYEEKFNAEINYRKFVTELAEI